MNNRNPYPPPRRRPPRPYPPPPPPEPPKRKWWQKALTGLGVFVLIALIAGIMSDEDPSEAKARVADNADSDEIAEAQAAADPDSAEEEVLKIGSIGNYKDLLLTVSDCFTVDPANWFTDPKEGCRYVAVAVTFKNNTGKQVSINPLDFKIKTGQGELKIYDGFAVKSDDALNCMDLAPEGITSGLLFFEVGQNDDTLELYYYGVAFSDTPKLIFELHE